MSSIFRRQRLEEHKLQASLGYIDSISETEKEEEKMEKEEKKEK